MEPRAVDECISAAPADARPKLREMENAILEAAPGPLVKRLVKAAARKDAERGASA